MDVLFATVSFQRKPWHRVPPLPFKCWNRHVQISDLSCFSGEQAAGGLIVVTNLILVQNEAVVIPDESEYITQCCNETSVWLMKQWEPILLCTQYLANNGAGCASLSASSTETSTSPSCPRCLGFNCAACVWLMWSCDPLNLPPRSAAHGFSCWWTPGEIQALIKVCLIKVCLIKSQRKSGACDLSSTSAAGAFFLLLLLSRHWCLHRLACTQLTS